MNRIFTVMVLMLSSLAVVYGGRIKDLTNVEGDRDNQLIGYGIVVGLAGDGDSNAATTLRSVANVLQRFGLSLNPQDIKAKNVAAVMITANISAFLKPGARIDVTISSMGDAKTLQGGADRRHHHNCRQ